MVITKKSVWPKIGALIVTIATSSLISWYIYRRIGIDKEILNFNYTRDAKEILDIFERDRYWLTATEDFSPEFMLKYRAPSQHDLRYLGRLIIKVIRKDDSFVGFVAYYMKSSTVGQILFLDVNPAYRGKGYSERLLKYALNNLKSVGANIAKLVTRTTNIHAQNLYKRLGFKETSQIEGFVYFAKQL